MAVVGLVCLFLASIVCSAAGSVSDCKFTTSTGKTVDLSPLISKE